MRVWWSSTEADCTLALAGVVDAYWEFRLKPWDVCAGVLMVEEAGGRVTTMDGLPYSVFDRSLLASNLNLHSKVGEAVERRLWLPCACSSGCCVPGG